MGFFGLIPRFMPALCGLAAFVVVAWGTCDRASAEDAAQPAPRALKRSSTLRKSGDSTSSSASVAPQDGLQVPATANPTGPVMSRLIERYDANHNGRLDTAERDAATAEMLKRFDANGNGRLDDAERTKALESWGARRPEPKQPDESRLRRRLIDRFDEDHDGRLDAAELKRAVKQLNTGRNRTTDSLRADLLHRLDANGDEQLDREELDGLAAPSPNAPPAATRGAADGEQQTRVRGRKGQ